MEKLEKLPPQALEMEKNVLGAMLIDREAAGVALEMLRPTDFYRGAHRRIFQVAGELYGREQVIDQSLLRQELAKAEALEEVGGAAYIADLASSVATSAHIEQYAAAVRERALAREVIRVGTDMVRDAFEPGQNAADLVERASASIYELAATGRTRQAASAGEIADEILRLADSEMVGAGIATGLPVFDDLLAGLRGGELIILAARPNVGKTTMALNILLNLAANQTAVQLFSVEMTRQAVAMHFVLMRTGIDLFRARPTDDAKARIAEVAAELRNCPFIVDDCRADLPTIRGRARRARTQGKCDLVIVDYLQQVRPPEQAEKRSEAVGMIAQGLKGLAKDLDVPVLALCQLNRESEKREDRRPRLADLRESGDIEQEADAVILLHRPNPRGSVNGNLIEMDLAKSRNTPTGRGQAWADWRTKMIYPEQYMVPGAEPETAAAPPAQTQAEARVDGGIPF